MNTGNSLAISHPELKLNIYSIYINFICINLTYQDISNILKVIEFIMLSAP